jgi:hypothetical protein
MFEVPMVVPLTVPSSSLPNARKAMSDALKHGDYVLNLNEVIAAHAVRGTDPSKWVASMAWLCPHCNSEQFFRLGQETCFSYCKACSKRFIIVEGYIKREEGGCVACEQRVNCLLIQHAHPVYISEDDLLG